MTRSDCQLGVLPRANQRQSALHGAQPIARAGFQISHVLSTSIGKLVMLQVAPDVLRRVKFRRVGSERLDLHAPLSASR